jgi:HSP20 family protein
MNATCCTPAPQTSTQAAPTAGVTESLQKPRFSIDRQDDAFVIRVEMPGVPKSGVNIEYHEDVLSVSGQRSVAVPADWKPLHQEISTLNYQLRLNVNTPVDDERLSATLEDGVLTLTLPVKPTALPRQIAVN